MLTVVMMSVAMMTVAMGKGLLTAADEKVLSCGFEVTHVM
jgi:hypothetical protein